MGRARVSQTLELSQKSIFFKDFARKGINQVRDFYSSGRKLKQKLD